MLSQTYSKIYISYTEHLRFSGCFIITINDVYLLCQLHCFNLAYPCRSVFDLI